MKRKIPLYYKGIIGILVILGIVVLSAIIIRLDSINIDDPKVQELYNFLGDNYLDYCNGLPFYNGEEVNYSTLSVVQRKCVAFKQINKSKIGSEEINKDKKKDQCSFSKDIIFRLDNEKQTCSYDTIDEKDLERAYKKIYNEKLDNHADFELSDTKICYYEKEKSRYVCANPMEQTVELGWAPTTYRVISRAKEKGSKILIYDYYLAINNDRCYITNDGRNENLECSEKLNKKTKYNSRLVTKYGKKYLHTFNVDKNGNYYWESTTPIN